MKFPMLAVTAALAAALVTTTVRAESLGSTASSASSAGSASSGSLSDSVQGSSRSSGGDAKVADGHYRVIDVADAPAKPGFVQLRLQGDAPANAGDAAPTLTLTVPARALQPQGMAAGQVVQVRNRAYGLEFARVGGRTAPEPFFLALEDTWLQDLRSQPLSL